MAVDHSRCPPFSLSLFYECRSLTIFKGYSSASTILGCLAILLVPIPFIPERSGTTLRAKSPFARQHMDDDDEISTMLSHRPSR
ncbi:hypothetical protein EDD36DRAFT_43278 [Exophiala viscosa]|uniref:Uncharacterized protein n=1 Tax=Exophiala viscosa TaxID=2486360 RepID=A0AAN6E635_9EURO|nr:hypothetical protein EDD36DRAFT_43278 [Exophiala viscosa]